MTAYLDHLAVERGLAGNTIAAYRRDLVRYAEYLGGRLGGQGGAVPLDAVGEREIAGYLRSLREEGGLSAASAARAISAVRGLHRFAAREGLVAEDASRDVTPPVPPRRLPRALAVDEVQRLLDAAAGDGPVLSLRDDPLLSLRDAALLEFLYGTGARVSEAVGLAVDDLDLTAHSVRLLGKGGRARVVPVGGYARAAVEAYLVRARPALLARARTVRSSPVLFRNARGAPLTRQGAWLVLRAAAARAGLRADLSPHVLRHSFATHLLDGGADVRVVQELLGHACVTTTQVYTLVTVEKLREVYAVSHPRAR